MRVEVNADDIAHAMRGEPEGCPIALALCRCGWAEKPHLTRFSAFDAESPSKCVLLPFEARQFVAEFDAGKPVHPFTFEIEDLEPVEAISC